MSKARPFSKVGSDVWRSRRFQALGHFEKLVHLYLLTCEHQNSSGCIRVPPAYAAADLGCTVDEYLSAQKTLIVSHLIAVDEETDEIYVYRWFKHNPLHNESHAKGTMRLVERIDSDAIREIVESDFVAANNERLARETNGKPSAPHSSRLLETRVMQGR
jgi:hypothetical protein